MTNDECRMSNVECRMSNVECRMMNQNALKPQALTICRFAGLQVCRFTDLLIDNPITQDLILNAFDFSIVAGFGVEGHHTI